MWERTFSLGPFFFEVTVYRWYWPADWLIGVAVGFTSLSLDFVVGSVELQWGME